MIKSNTLETLGTQHRIVQSSHFNRDMWDNSIKPSLFNLLSHRAEAARLILNPELTTERHKELVDYFDYCNYQILLLLGLKTHKNYEQD
jgi:hypothetical protein